MTASLERRVFVCCIVASLFRIFYRDFGICNSRTQTGTTFIVYLPNIILIDNTKTTKRYNEKDADQYEIIKKSLNDKHIS